MAEPQEPEGDRRESPVQRRWRARLMRFLRRRGGRWYTVPHLARGAGLVPWAVERAVDFNLRHDSGRPGLYNGVLDVRRRGDGALEVRFDGERYRANRDALLTEHWSHPDVRGEERLRLLPWWLWRTGRRVVARVVHGRQGRAGAEDG